jgi:hypothetical protein
MFLDGLLDMTARASSAQSHSIGLFDMTHNIGKMLWCSMLGGVVYTHTLNHAVLEVSIR